MLYRNIKLLKHLEFSSYNRLLQKQLHVSSAVSCAKKPKTPKSGEGAKSAPAKPAAPKPAAAQKKGPQEKVSNYNFHR